MPVSSETAKVKLVTIIAREELLDGLEEQLKAVGTSGYTVGRADGRGQSGPRTKGFLTLANVRVEALLRPSDAQTLLERLAHAYGDREIVAFSHEVDAIPKEHFD